MNEIWYPQNYNPGLSVEDWKKLLQDKNIFSVSGFEVVRRFTDYGDRATYQQLAYCYGEDAEFYRKEIFDLGKKIAAETNCPIFQNRNYRNILLLERGARIGARSTFNDTNIYKLRDEIKVALGGNFGGNLFTNERKSARIDFTEERHIRSLEKLKYVILDTGRKIPIYAVFAIDDCKCYHIAKTENRVDNRLTDDIAIKLLALGLAYQVSKRDYEIIKSESKKFSSRFTAIRSEEYENLKLQLMS